ncbi:MAG TPA: hypothetical protein ENJ95_17075 [Bacteroidetes bacterium]|nr:hypothetical protein [Bacteroidota bacterium]
MESLFNKKYLPVIITGIVCAALGTALGWNLSRGGVKSTDIKLNFGSNSLEVNLDQDEIDAETFLGRIFEQGFSKSGAMDWLKLKQKIFHFKDPDIVKEFKTLPPDDPVSEQLYKLSASKTGPWAYQVDTVRISIPEKKYQPRKGFVNVCENGKYRGRMLQLYNLDQSIAIDLTASGKYACPTGLKFPDIQLNAKDAKKLLGDDNFSKYEEAIVLILQ